MKNDPLIEKLRNAAKKEISIHASEEFVGQKPILSTLERNGWDMLKMVDIGPDETYKEELPELSEITNAIYWKAEDEKAFVRIAGLWYDKYEKPVLFVGRIYAP